MNAGFEKRCAKGPQPCGSAIDLAVRVNTGRVYAERKVGRMVQRNDTMKTADSIDLLKEVAKTVVETLEADAELQVIDDVEHLKRVRSIVGALSGLLERESIPARDRVEFERGTKAFARELFLRRCRNARKDQDNADDREEIEEDRRYFEKLYDAKVKRRKTGR